MNADDRKLAPHVDPAWAEAMLIELRLQGVAGSDIGAALSEVESHCAEGGTAARDSFGDPTDYARPRHQADLRPGRGHRHDEPPLHPRGPAK